MIMVTVQVADLSHENFKSSRVMRWWRSRLSSCFGAKSSRERKPKWLSGLRRRNVQNAWKSTFSITPLSFDVPSPDYPCEYPQKSYTARNKSHWPTFPPVIVWVYLHSFFFVVGSQRRIFSATQCVWAIQGHPRSLILAPIERAYATSY